MLDALIKYYKQLAVSYSIFLMHANTYSVMAHYWRSAYKNCESTSSNELTELKTNTEHKSIRNYKPVSACNENEISPRVSSWSNIFSSNPYIYTFYDFHLWIGLYNALQYCHWLAPLGYLISINKWTWESVEAKVSLTTTHQKERNKWVGCSQDYWP